MFYAHCSLTSNSVRHICWWQMSWHVMPQPRSVVAIRVLMMIAINMSRAMAISMIRVMAINTIMSINVIRLMAINMI